MAFKCILMVKLEKCWLLEHCLSQIEAPCGFPLTLESLLVIGEVTRCNIELAQLYMEKIVKCICLRLLQDTDPGIQIRCAKALSLVCSSILQEMEKEECRKIDFILSSNPNIYFSFTLFLKETLKNGFEILVDNNNPAF